MTLRRVQKEYKLLQEDPSLLPNAVVVPNPDNILEWHFIVYGLDEPYKGGVYHGVVELPSNYPKSPPGIKMFTPSGRFMPNYKLCLSISDYHPESWNPSWKTYQVILGLLSVMSEDKEFGVGMMADSKEVRMNYAKESLAFNERKAIFKQLFEVRINLFIYLQPYYEKIGIKEPSQENNENEEAKVNKPVIGIDMDKVIENHIKRNQSRDTFLDYAVPIGAVSDLINILSSF